MVVDAFCEALMPQPRSPGPKLPRNVHQCVYVQKAMSNLRSNGLTTATAGNETSLCHFSVLLSYFLWPGPPLCHACLHRPQLVRCGPATIAPAAPAPRPSLLSQFLVCSVGHWPRLWPQGSKSLPPWLGFCVPCLGSPVLRACLHRGGGGVARGQFQRIISEGENFATSRNPEACCYFQAGSGWFLLFLMHSSHTTTACCQQTHLCPSLRLVHRCTCLNSQYSPASEFAMKSLVTRRVNFARGKFRHCS